MHFTKIQQNFLTDAYLKVAAIQEARKRFSRQLAPNFSIFDFLRSDELGFSACLATLLDPLGDHGQGDVFLVEFVKVVDPDGNLEFIDRFIKDDFLSCRVQTERQAENQRRIDIYLKFEYGVIGIENKPWAADQNNQLSDYANYLRDQAKNDSWLLIYLSNREPSSNSIMRDKVKEWTESKNFISIDYVRLCKWLRACSAQASALVVRVFIEELEKFVHKNINGEADMEEQNEMKKLILSDTKNIDSAFHVINSMDLVKAELLKKFRYDLNDSLAKQGLHLVWDECMSPLAKSSSGFGVKFDLRQDRYLRFEFEGSQLFKLTWGICIEGAHVKNDSKIWDEINAIMTKEFHSGMRTVWWGWYCTNLSADLSEIPKNWGKDATVWKMMSQDELAPIIVNLALKVKAVLSGKNLSLLMP